MAKKLRPKNKPGKVKGKKPKRRVSLLSISRRPPKKVKKPEKKNAVIKPKLLPVKKKPALKKTAALKKSPGNPKLFSIKRNKRDPKPVNEKKPAATFIDTEKLPDHYNSTDVTLMVRDPYWIHAYWETTPSSIQEVKKKIGAAFKKSVYTLRIHDISADQSKAKNARTHFDIDVDPKAKNWYINLWCDNVTYYADFGVRTPKGVFYPLARSNTVTLPRAATTPGKPDAIWMRVKEKGECSIVDVAERKPLAAPLGPLTDTDPRTENVLFQSLPKPSADNEFTTSDSGFSTNTTGFFGSNQLEQTPAPGGSSASPW
jgi:hypothetical protein